MIRRDEVYHIGRIGRTHGTGGELTFMFDDDVFLDDSAEYLVLDIDGILVPFFIDGCRLKSGSTALITFEGIGSQERARQLTGREVYFPRRSFDDAEGVLSAAEMIGFEVQDESFGGPIGTLSAIDDSTANPLFEVADSEGNTLLLPAADDLIVGIDPVRRRITMRLPDGILDLNKKES